MLTFPGDKVRTPGDFLERHWQRQPLFLRDGASTAALPEISPDELAWLATLDDVESRLVFTESRDGKTCYRMETGPFSDETLRALPEDNWTLLVQDVEKHLPAFRSYLALVPFVPDWRVDDLMVSVAAPGGSVGPHVDNYDVFLVQATGSRHWKWTASTVPFCPDKSDQLRLVEDFVGDAEATARPGDVLYLNPGVAHFGIAEDLCVTCSIGMRAPQVSELAGRSVEGEDTFYTDRELDPAEARPGYISPAALRRAKALLARHGFESVDPELAIGRYATSPKEWLRPQGGESLPGLSEAIDVHGMARLAWTDKTVFANGRAHALPGSLASDLEAICRSRQLDAATLGRWFDDPLSRELLGSLVADGVFDVDGLVHNELSDGDM